jgi:hypothetical protein
VRLITLTEPNGDEIEIDADQISELALNKGAYAKPAKTIVSMQNGHQHAVKETMAQITTISRSAALGQQRT